MSDNYTFSLRCVSLNLALPVAFAPHSKAWGYKADENGFVLFWTEAKGAIPFPIPLEWPEVKPLIEGWLKEKANFGGTPDLDGDAEQSCLVETGPWGHVTEFGWQSFAIIKPTWALYGK